MLKKYFFIFILIFVFSCSFCYAWTYSEFQDFLESTANEGTQKRKDAINYYLSYKNRIDSWISTNATFNTSDMSSFWLRSFDGTNLEISFAVLGQLTRTSSTRLTGNSSKYYVINVASSGNVIRQVSSYPTGTNLTLDLSYDNNKCFTGLTQPEITNLTSYEPSYLFQNYYNGFILLGAEERNLNNLPWLFAQAIVGGNYINQNSNFRLYDLDDNFIMYLTANNETSSNGIYTYNLNIPYVTWNNNSIINGNQYIVKYNDNSNNFFTSDPFVISWERDTSNDVPTYNNSGDTTGYIDLSSTNNKIDLVNQSIQQQTQAILSGDKMLRNAIISGDAALLSALTDTSYSGSLYSGDLPVLQIDDPSESFFTWLMEHIEDVLLDNNVTTLVIPIYDQNYEIRSDIFIFNIEPLKTFISIGWWFVCGVPILKWVRHFIETLRSGNIPQVDDKSDLLGNVL